jgi:hypothetical protein
MTAAVVVRRITCDRLEYFRVAHRGVDRLNTVRRTRANGRLACLTHKSASCADVDAVRKHLERGRIRRPLEVAR